MKTKKNLGKRALSLVLTLLMVLSLVPMSVFSAFAEELPELSATIDTGDSITLKDADADGYYDITNADELYAFAAIVNGGNASINGEFTADIVVNENVLNEDGTPKVNGDFREWMPIGDSSYGYSGIFDGQNHIVSGLYILDLTKDYVGLFGYADNATVKNTGVIDSLIMGNNYVGGVCGQAYSSKVINCYNSGVINGMGYIGGVVGDIDDSTITNCYNTGTVRGRDSVGGVSGNAYASKVIDCYNTGEVKGSNEVVGGVVGKNEGGGTITNCYNTGTVSSMDCAGGVVGFNYGGATITNCYNTGAVSGGERVGGVVGYNYESTITNCYNTGDVSRTTNGGCVVGEYEGGTVTNCYYLEIDAAGGIGRHDREGSAEYKTPEQFESGEVAYLLGEAFGQKLGEDMLPVLGGDKVYFGYENCEDDAEKIYTNTEAYDEKPSHSWDNGVCTICNNACEHQWEDGVCTVCEKACEHEDYANGFCADCGGFEPATYNEETGNYEIGNAGQLYWFAEFVNAGNVSANAELTANIVVNESSTGSTSTDKISWVPIGTSTAPFKGKFNGNNNTISGLYNGDKLLDGVGLFGYATDCTVENVGVINSKFLGANRIGAVVGNLGNNSSIYNCYNSGTYISDGSSSEIGGVIGYMGENNVVENCYNKATVFGAKHGGGIVGYAETDNTIRECYNSGYITLRDIGGGIVGYAADNNLIIDCYNIGMVEIGDTAGGIAAQIVNSDIENCYSIGSVLSNRNFGGIAGVQTGCTFDNCYYLYDSCPDSPDIYGVESIVSGHLELGELAYNLQGDREDHVWGQKIDSDKYPVIGGDKVYYGYILCLQNARKVYTNSFASDEKPPHNYDNGFCTVCKIAEPATYNEETGNYEIGNAGQLYWFADKVNNDNANFGSANAVLTADIVVNEGVMDENSTNARAWTPIGSYEIQYKGTFDGKNKTVSGLYFNNSEVSCVGLFGCVGENGTVKNIGVINSYFNGYFRVGGVVGLTDGGATITNCYNAGTVSGYWYVGGVVGDNYAGTTTDCYNTGTVIGSLYVGGVAGDNYAGTTTDCYNTGTVIGNWYVGGVVGYNYDSTTTDCYNTGTVSGSEYVGGVVGEDDGGTVTNCYYSDTAYAGGINGEDITGSAEAKTLDEFKSGEVAYLLGEAFGQTLGEDDTPVLGGDKVYFGYTDCSDAEKVYSNTELSVEKPAHNFANGFCTVCDAFEPAKYNNNCSTDDESDDFYEISNAGQLYWFADKVNNDNANFGSANAVLTADIVVNEGVMDENSTGVRAWTPIGSDSNQYTGTFDGNGKTVSGLYFNNSEVKYVGLFGCVDKNGTVKNIGVINSYFNGYYFVGGVVGCSDGDGTITNCYNTGTVIGNWYVGGVVGYSYDSTIANCYNTGTVSGEDYVGGVVGDIDDSTITNCYYSDTTCEGGINGEDITGSAEAKTLDEFKSGEVAYLLGEAFGQTLGEDDTPVLGGDKVYCGYDTCDEDVDQVYSNEALSYERLSHVWNDGFCTVCDKACEHTGGTATCTKLAVCEICGTEYGDLDVNNHVGESTPEFNWFAPSYGSCYVDINLICDDCESSVAYDYGYASVAESAEGTDCLNPGYELYEITFEIDGVSYTDSYKHILKSDNHVGEFENGFCSVCGGFEPAYYNEETGVYEISNAGQLYWYAQKLNEENAEMSVVLTENIVIPEDAPNWEPITASYVTFDGQFHTVSGINSVHEDYTYVGMFGNEVWWYEIKNLHLTDSNFEGSDYVGGLVASMNNGGTVENCYVTNTTVKGGNDTGTLVGFLGMSNVINCYVDTDTLVGDFNGYGSIENSYYVAEAETEDGGKTLDEFKSGEVAYLLQSGIVGEPLVDEEGYYIYDEEGNLIYDTENVPLVWGQTIGEEDYPVFNGAKVYLSDEGYYNKLDKLAGYTIGLGDKIAVNYYMSLTEKTLSDENAKMVFTVPDTGSTYTVEIPVSEAVKSGDYYVFTCEVAAKEMTSVIKAKFVTSESELRLDDYTVQQYAEVILSDTVKYANEQELVKAMLNYGAEAQIYFNYNTESLANSILDEADRVLSDADLSSYELALTDNDEIVSYYGSALSLETETAIKCYFIIDGDAEAFTATVNGEKAELKKNGTLYELKISGISAHQLGNMYEIKVGDLTLTYGAFSYGYTATSSTKDSLKNVVKAMYEYNQMAVDYKG